MGDPLLCQRGGEAGGIAADQIGLLDSGEIGGERLDPARLALAAGDPADAGKGAQGMGGAFGIGGLAVIDEGNAADLGDEAAAVRQAGEGPETLLDLFRREAQRAQGAIGGAGVLVVVGARKPFHRAQIDRGHLPALAPFGKEAPAREDRPAEAAELPARGNADHLIVERAFGHLAGEEHPLGLVDPDHRAIGAALGKEPALGGEIAAPPAVAIEVIVGEIGEDGDIGGEGAGEIALVARKLEHKHLAVMGRFGIEHAKPDIARHLRRAPRRFQHVVDEGDGGGFAVGAGDGDHARRGGEAVPALGGPGTEEEADVVVERHAGAHGRFHGGVRGGVEMGDAGRDDQERHAVKGAGAGEIGQFDALRPGLRARLFAVIPGDHLGASGPERGGGREPRTPEPQHRHPAAFVSARRDHPSAPSAWPARSGRG